MITFHAQQTIARPTDEVFGLAADFSQHPDILEGPPPTRPAGSDS